MSCAWPTSTRRLTSPTAPPSATALRFSPARERPLANSSTVGAARGRVNLMGEHTDYNDGFVLPMAIERYMVMAGDRNSERQATLHSITAGERATFSLRPPIARGEPAWSNYVRGVVAG